MAKCVLLGCGGSSIDEDLLTATPPKVIKSLTFVGHGSDEPQVGTLEIDYSNIAIGVTILGKSGTYTGKGNAEAAQVLKSYTASNKYTSNFVGTLPNQGSLNDKAPINYSKTLSAGYYSSIKVSQNLNKWECPSSDSGVISAYGGVTNGKIYDDPTRGRGLLVKVMNNARLINANWVFLSMPDLKPENIRSGITIYGVEGTAKSPFPDGDILLYDAGTWMNDAIHGADIVCKEIYESYPNGNTYWEADHSEYVNYGNTVGGAGVTNERWDRWELYTESNSYSSPMKVYQFNGYGGEVYYKYGYLDDYGRWRDDNGVIYYKFSDTPGYRIFLDVPASSGVKRGQARINCIAPGDSITRDPLIGKKLQGYMLNNSHNFYKCNGPYGLYSQDQFTFKYYTKVGNDEPQYPDGNYTGLRYRDIYQTARRAGFYAYVDHSSRHYVDEWDTFVDLRDNIDVTKYAKIAVNGYLVWNHCNAGVAYSYSKYSYNIICSVVITRKYYDEQRGIERSETAQDKLYLGQANIKWDDQHSENGVTELNCPGPLEVHSGYCNIPKITIDRTGKSKYYIRLHFWGENDGGSSTVSTPFKAKLIITGIKLVPGEKVYTDPNTLIPYESVNKKRNYSTGDYEYIPGQKVTVENNAIYWEGNASESSYRSYGYCGWFEGYNGKLDPFVIYKNNNEYYLTRNSVKKKTDVEFTNRFIPYKPGKLYKVIEVVSYLYRAATGYSAAKYNTYTTKNFYICKGYNLMEKVEPLYIDVDTGKVYSYIKVLRVKESTWSRYYKLSIDFSQSTLANKTPGVVYRVYAVKNDNDYLNKIFGLAINYDDEVVATYLSNLTTGFYGYMKCNSNRTTFEYVKGWEYPVPEDNPIAYRVYEL